MIFWKNLRRQKNASDIYPKCRPLYFDMTVLEYLKFVADLKKIPKDKKATMIEEIMDMVKITDMKNRSDQEPF